MTIDKHHNQGPPIEHDEEANPYGRQGYVLIGRELRDHPLVGFGRSSTPADPIKRFCYSKGEAWLDLIMECRYEAGRVNNGGRLMEIQPGQLIGAVSWLGSRWNWTPKAVRHFLDQLEEEGMITIQTAANTPSPDDHQNQEALFSQTNQRTDTGKHGGKQRGKQAAVLTISKYEIFQRWYRQQGQAPGQAEGQVRGKSGASEGQHLNTLNKGIEDTNTLREGGLEGDAPRSATARVCAPQVSNVVQLPVPMPTYQTLGIPATMRDQPLVQPELLQLVPAPEAPAKKPKKTKARKPVVLLADDWRLPARYGEWALTTFAVTRDDVLREAQKFRDHWLAKGEGKADWFATWRNWCSSDYRRWTLRPGASKAIAEDAFDEIPDVVEAEVVEIDPWDAAREQQARLRQEAAE
jgi:hypothetical protein